MSASPHGWVAARDVHRLPIDPVLVREAADLAATKAGNGGTGAMREAGIEKHLRDASIFFRMDGTNDIHRFKIAKALFPESAGTYAGANGAGGRDPEADARGAQSGKNPDDRPAVTRGRLEAPRPHCSSHEPEVA